MIEEKSTETARKEDRRQAAQKLFSEQTHANRMFAMNSSVEYGKIFIRFMFLLNGGAIVALLTLVGAFAGKNVIPLAPQYAIFAFDVIVAVYWYIGGLIATSITAAVSYINWAMVLGTYLNEGHTSMIVEGKDMFGGQSETDELAKFAKFDLWNDRTFWLAIAAGLISLSCFVAGSLKIVFALPVLFKS